MDPLSIGKTTLGVEKEVQDEAIRLRSDYSALVARLKLAFEDVRKRITELEHDNVDILEDLNSLWKAQFGEEPEGPQEGETF